MWQSLLRNKYLRHKAITQVEYMYEDSHFWSGLMKVKSDFLRLANSNLEMVLRSGFGRTFGYVTLLSNQSFQHYMIY
jgi:hypothetical protein